MAHYGLGINQQCNSVNKKNDGVDNGREGGDSLVHVLLATPCLLVGVISLLLRCPQPASPLVVIRLLLTHQENAQNNPRPVGTVAAANEIPGSFRFGLRSTPLKAGDPTMMGGWQESLQQGAAITNRGGRPLVDPFLVIAK